MSHRTHTSRRKYSVGTEEQRPNRPLRLLELVRSQGMLFPKQHIPVHIDAAQIPDGFLEAFEHRDCAATDCGSCGYCETISQQAVRIEPEFHRTSLEKFRAVQNALKTGRLWSISGLPHG